MSKTRDQERADRFADTCAEQIMRLSVFRDSFPFDAEGRKELGRQLQRVAKSDEHAKQIIFTAVSQEERCPTPARLRAIAEQTQTEERTLPTGCAECSGTGNRSVERPPGSGYWYSGRCTCARGRHFSALDAERRSKTA